MSFFKDTPVENDDTKEYTYEVESDNVEEVLAGETKPDKVERFDVSKAEELKAKESTKERIETLAKAEPVEPKAEPGKTKETENMSENTIVKAESVKNMPKEPINNDSLPVLKIPEGVVIKGDLEIEGNVLIEGTIVGDTLIANDIVINAKSNKLKTIKGDNLKVKGNGKLISGLEAKASIMIDGAIKGQITAPEVTLTDNAIVSGDILCEHFNTSDKAKIKGAVKFYSDEATDIDDIFKE